MDLVIVNRFQTLLVSMLLATAGLAVAGTPSFGADLPSTDSVGTVTVGIDGHCRAGHWAGIRFSGDDPITAIETRDGDGVRTVYRPQGNSKWSYVVPGSEAAPLVLHGPHSELRSTRFPTVGSPSRGPAMIAREMRWVIALGDPLGIDSIGANKLLRRDATVGVTKPVDAASLPDSTLGYDGVDMMVISGSSVDLLRDLDGQQQLAIRQWIVDGGYVFLTLGRSAETLLDVAPWLLDLIPLDQTEPVKINPSALETFTSTQTPLDSFDGVKLSKNSGRVIVRGRTERNTSTPLAVEYTVGFGQIVVIAADLENEMFANWPERLDLITQLTGSMLIPESQEGSTRNRSTAYDDLAGQLRASLDQFTSSRNFGFSIVSLILMGLIALIGPLDYLLINRLLGRPLLGWITFPLIAIVFSVVLVIQSQPANSGSARPTEVGRATSQSAAAFETNQIEIFDIDTTVGVGRGFALRYFYSHDARLVDVNVTSGKSLESMSGEVQTMVTVPFGSPGSAFGGIPISIEDARLPSYDIPFHFQNTVQQTQHPSTTSRISSRLVGLPIASRSSKGIVSRCRFLPKLESEVSLMRRPGSELLQGELVNPLPVDLFDALLVYRNWAYRLPTRFPAGGRIESVAGLRQKNFRWQLSHQEALEESARQTEPWDPSKLDSLERIAEMLMFHQAAGGSRYTTLRHDPLSGLDLSGVLTDDRCMLVGRLAQPLTVCRSSAANSADDVSLDQDVGRTLSLIRVVLPVHQKSRR